MLARPDVPARGHYRPYEPRPGVPRGGHCRHKCPRRLPTGWHRWCLALFRARLERMFDHFSSTSEKGPRRETAGSDLHHAPEAWRSRREALQAQRGKDWCSRTGTLQAQILTRLLIVLSNTSQTEWCCSGSPHPILHLDPLRRLSSTTFHVLERSRMFKDHLAVELITSSRGPSTPKRIGRGVPNFGSAVGDRQNQNAVLSGTCAQFTQNPAMKNHLLNSGNKLLAEPNLLDPVWGVGLQADEPRTSHPCQWIKTIFSVRNVLPFAKQFATSETGSAYPASPSRFRTCTTNERKPKSRPRRGRAVNSVQR